MSIDHLVFFAVLAAAVLLGRLFTKSWFTGLLVLLGPVGLLIGVATWIVHANARRSAASRDTHSGGSPSPRRDSELVVAAGAGQRHARRERAGGAGRSTSGIGPVRAAPRLRPRG